jgi:hypothetical protein
MKLEVGRLNVLTVADSWENLVNPSRVGIRHPAGRCATGRDVGIPCFILELIVGVATKVQLKRQCMKGLSKK